jgi:hypothetical protein
MKKLKVPGLAVLLALTILVVGMCAGCGGGNTTSLGTTPFTSPTSTTAVSSPESSTSPEVGTDDAGSSTLPKYEPSSVVSDSPGSLQLTSPDSVKKVTVFYDNLLTKGGWKIVSSSKTAYSTNITATKGSTGTTLSVSVSGSGTYISLVTYPI